jgi:DNA-binding FadR family transcriptional regulator
MKRKSFHVAFPAKAVVLMVMFLSAFFIANVNPSFAASDKKKSSSVARTSAVEHTEAQIKQLQSALNITEAQQELWKNVIQTMRENAKDMDAITKERAEQIKTMNAVEHMKFHSKITEAQLNHAKKLIPPFEALYASMSDEQKKSTDTIFRTGKHGKQKRK